MVARAMAVLSKAELLVEIPSKADNLVRWIATLNLLLASIGACLVLKAGAQLRVGTREFAFGMFGLSWVPLEGVETTRDLEYLVLDLETMLLCQIQDRSGCESSLLNLEGCFYISLPDGSGIMTLSSLIWRVTRK